MSILSNMNISEKTRPIVIKFHLEHYWGRELSFFVFQPDLNKTLVSMTTDSSLRVIMEENLVTTQIGSKIRNFGVSCPRAFEKIPHRLIMREMV